jgi:hypothetical protein
MTGCDGCTMCCKIMGVTELEKPRDTNCKFCAKGRGCTIYSNRPESCKNFECLWLQSQSPDVPYTFGPELRPDRCRVVMYPTTSGKGVIANVDPMRPNAWQHPNVQRILDAFKPIGPVVIAIGSKRIVGGKMTAEQARIAIERGVVEEDL